MKDIIIKGTGNSRSLKSAIPSGTSWESALAMLRDGSFPIDLAGLNNAGVDQQGSAYNKANVLPQIVCEELGIDDSTAEPKDAFLAIVNNLVNLYAWAKYTYASEYYTIGSALGQKYLWHTTSNYGSTYKIVYSYSNSITVAEDGTVSLVNPSDVNVYKGSSSSASGYSSLVGKYFKYKSKDSSHTYISTDLNTSTVYYWPTNATVSGTDSGSYIYVTGLQAVTGTSAHDASMAAGLVERVTSRNASAYPSDGKSGNYWYISEGQVGQKAQIQYGSYIGTGTYGSDGQNVIGFAFTPRFVAVIGPSTSVPMTSPKLAFFINPYDKTYTLESAPYSYTVTWGTDTVSWYGGSQASNQMNMSGTAYYYIAIG